MLIKVPLCNSFRTLEEFVLYITNVLLDPANEEDNRRTILMEYDTGASEIWTISKTQYKIVADNYSLFDYDNEIPQWTDYANCPEGVWKSLTLITELW